MKTHLELGRDAVSEGRWEAAHESLSAARRERPLSPEDLWRFAMAAYLVGRPAAFLEALRGAYNSNQDSNRGLDAARAAFWIGYHLSSRGDVAAASGWFGRAARVAGQHDGDGAALGYALLPAGHRQLTDGAYGESERTLERVADIGRRCGERDLTALALHAQGRVKLRTGRVEAGLALLDEVMVAVVDSEPSPIATGLICCSALSACREVYDLSRAREWTSVLQAWCDLQPDMVPYTGPCQLSRAEILRQGGDLTAAIDEALRAVESFERWPGPGSPGPAFYVEAEVHRVRGHYAAAEAAYRKAAAAGRDPQPGLSLLRLSQGAPEVALASLERALGEAPAPVQRAGLLPAMLEVLLALGDLGLAGRASQELEEIARAWPAGLLTAMAASGKGSTLLAAGEPDAALVVLRGALRAWTELGVPYESARVRVRLARACRTLGDDEGSVLELDAAREAFERMGAAPDLVRLEDLAGGRSPGAAHGLTPRELEVLGWLATGRTNRAIAGALYISEKTVARHVSNIYAKLGVATRSAATAYAFAHRLARPSA